MHSPCRDDDCVISISDSSSEDEISLADFGSSRWRSGGDRHFGVAVRVDSQVAVSPRTHWHGASMSEPLRLSRERREVLLQKADETVLRSSVSTSVSRKSQFAPPWESLDDLLASDSDIKLKRPEPSARKSQEQVQQLAPIDKVDTNAQHNTTEPANSSKSVSEILATWAVQEFTRAKSEEASMQELNDRLCHMEGLLQVRTRELQEVQQQAGFLRSELMSCNIDKKAALALLAARPAQHDNLCVICWDRDASHVLVPCGHLALCADCQAGDRCPVCRQPNTSVIQMYRP